MKTLASLSRVALALVIATAGLLPTLSLAAEPVGRVLFAIGDAKLANGGAIKKDDTLQVGQTIITGANGHVHIRFVDDAFVSVRPNSSLSIEQYVYDRSEEHTSELQSH